MKKLTSWKKIGIIVFLSITLLVIIGIILWKCNVFSSLSSNNTSSKNSDYMVENDFGDTNKGDSLFIEDAILHESSDVISNYINVSSVPISDVSKANIENTHTEFKHDQCFIENIVFRGSEQDIQENKENVSKIVDNIYFSGSVRQMDIVPKEDEDMKIILNFLVTLSTIEKWKKEKEEKDGSFMNHSLILQSDFKLNLSKQEIQNTLNKINIETQGRWHIILLGGTIDSWSQYGSNNLLKINSLSKISGFIVNSNFISDIRSSILDDTKEIIEKKKKKIFIPPGYSPHILSNSANLQLWLTDHSMIGHSSEDEKQEPKENKPFEIKDIQIIWCYEQPVKPTNAKEIEEVQDLYLRYFAIGHKLHFTLFTMREFTPTELKLNPSYSKELNIYVPEIFDYDPLLKYRYMVKEKDRMFSDDHDLVCFFDIDLHPITYINLPEGKQQELLLLKDTVNLLSSSNENVNHIGYPETNSFSLACIEYDEKMEYYISSRVQMGTPLRMEEFYKTIANQVEDDRKQNIFASHKGESYMNRYYLDNSENIGLLGYEYAFPKRCMNYNNNNNDDNNITKNNDRICKSLEGIEPKFVF